MSEAAAPLPRSTPPLHVCPGCGLVHTEWVRVLRAKDEDIANLERERRAQRQVIAELKGMQSFHPDTDDVLDHWASICYPQAKEIHSTSRRKPTSARLRGGYSADDLKRCLNGYALKPFVVGGRRSPEGPKDCLRVEPSLLFRDAEHVQSGLAIADRADDLRHAMSPPSPAGRTRGPSLGPLGAAAVRLARRGFAIFPCRKGRKDPATRHGLLDAKTDLAAIERTWAQHPDLNIAVATGMISGIVVLDIDGDDGWDSLHSLEDRYASLPTTASVETPRGGHHFYFAHPGVEVRNTASVPGPGLDIRGDGGYVLVPPSINAKLGRAYEPDDQVPIAPMPTWLLDRLKDHQQRADLAFSSGDFDALMKLNAAPGNRNDRVLKVAGSLVSHGYSGASAYDMARALNKVHCKPPLADKEVKAIVKSVVSMEARKR